jgi:hypothetical protein
VGLDGGKGMDEEEDLRRPRSLGTASCPATSAESFPKKTLSPVSPVSPVSPGLPAFRALSYFADFAHFADFGEGELHATPVFMPLLR